MVIWASGQCKGQCNVLGHDCNSVIIQWWFIDFNGIIILPDMTSYGSRCDKSVIGVSDKARLKSVSSATEAS